MQGAYEILQAYSCKERSLYHNDQKGSINRKCKEHMRFYKLIHARKEAYITVIRKEAKQKMQGAYEVLQAYSCKERNLYQSDQRGK